MHPKNRYQGKHDFPALARIVPELKNFFVTTPAGHVSLDFAHPDAVRHLNRALLLRDYGLKFWDLPPGSLCPGVPGRLDYIHAINDLLTEGALPQVPSKDKQKGPAKKQGPHSSQPTILDVGTGASLIYPILGVKEYNWNFVGTDIEDQSLKVAGAIVKFNPKLQRKIELRKQPQRQQIFRDVVRADDYFAATLCNPPFFADEQGATSAAKTKWEKLGEDEATGYNFGGNPNELWTPGGEPAFLRRMIIESGQFRKQVGWFTTLVSKKGYLHAAKQQLGKAKVKTVKIIPIGQGGKVRRILCWRY
ncbi:23S rRNA (adenine(1618)-N(6))-methyltransferase RlmF [Lewinella sp. 4G2]|uniref:23S rRNA (adenine(1618)-N(6))-methyltransferase RlmF n=1 Tax=Lewinella sp. 4G2 TaxID=1803372 RepID=UPI0007B4E191|nr:23S rRNA (adenine(1618)-N(6))-methyltransferase RlmF [Lewinella sp. 4G2]OAV44801.1 23S rRNA (adenine(1618)-N(6))-methyltransferase [Lewinella sp. 4G2]